MQLASVYRPSPKTFTMEVVTALMNCMHTAPSAYLMPARQSWGRHSALISQENSIAKKYSLQNCVTLFIELFYILGPGLSPLYTWSCSVFSTEKEEAKATSVARPEVDPELFNSTHHSLNTVLRAEVQVCPASLTVGMTHLRIIIVFHWSHSSLAIDAKISKIVSETQQAWSDLWNQPLPPLRSQRWLESSDKGTGLLCPIL